MTTLYDSTTPSEIPASAPMVAGYIDGLYAWTAADWQRLGGRHLTITVYGLHGADIADCESGDLTPQSASDWAIGECWSGRRPTIYSNRSTWPEVTAALGAYRPFVDWWAADPTGTPHLVPGSVATQYAWNQLGQTGGVNIDVSVTNGTWKQPRTTLVPVPTRPPIVGVAVTPTGKGYWEAAADGGVFSFGDAVFRGSLGGKALTAPIVGIETMGQGYVLVGADGAMYCFDAPYFGGRNQL